MEKLRLTFDYENALARIVLNAPKANIMDGIMMNELREIFLQLKGMKELKAITLEGAGDHFSFGASVEEHRREQAAEMLKNFHALFYAIADMNIPLIAKVKGQCLGGGMELVLACHFVFVTESARMGQPEVQLGVFAPPASVLLPLKVGQARAEEILLTGRLIRGDEAWEMGLANDIFNEAEMDERADFFFEKDLLPKSASSLRFAVNASRLRFNETVKTFLPRLEDLYVSELMATQDANEGINSFLERRQPVWHNC